MRRAGSALVACFATLVAACDGPHANGPGPASPAPSATATSIAVTDVVPGGTCNRRSEDFRYVDAFGRALPWLAYRSNGGLIASIKFWVGPPPNPAPQSTNIGYEIGPGSTPAPGAPVFSAVAGVPSIDLAVTYGPNDRAAAVLIPSGPLSNDYRRDLMDHYALAAAALKATTAVLDATPVPAGATPAPAATFPSPGPEDAWDDSYRANEAPVIAIVARGINPDDYAYEHVPAFSPTPVPREFPCFWLQNRRYDAYVTITHNVPAPNTAAQATLAAQLTAFHASANEIGHTRFIAESYEELVRTNIQPQFWNPDWLADVQHYEGYVAANAQRLNFQTLYTLPAPANPDATSAP